MTKRIFRSILTVTLTVLVASLVLIVGVLHGYFQDRALEELARSTAYIARGVEENGMAYLNDDLPKSSRITWVASDGTVLYDNSDTLSQKTVYYALRLSDGSVLRTSDTNYSVWMMVLQALQPVALMMVLAFCLALWLAGRVARQLVEPINAIDPSAPSEDVYEEVSPLLTKIRSQNRQIQRQLLDLQQRREVPRHRWKREKAF